MHHDIHKQVPSIQQAKLTTDACQCRVNIFHMKLTHDSAFNAVFTSLTQVVKADNGLFRWDASIADRVKSTHCICYHKICYLLLIAINTYRKHTLAIQVLLIKSFFPTTKYPNPTRLQIPHIWQLDTCMLHVKHQNLRYT